jgi:hypothetical protein
VAVGDSLELEVGQVRLAFSLEHLQAAWTRPF